MSKPNSIVRALTSTFVPTSKRDRDRNTRRLVRRLDRKLRDLHESEKLLRRRLLICAARGDHLGVRGHADQLVNVVHERKLLENLAPQRSRVEEVLVLSSLMLANSFRVCNETQDEGMHFIAGIEYDGLCIGTHIIPFPYAQRSIAGAAGDPKATHKIVIETHEARHRILALLHSHPGSGPDANFPSSIDDRTQRLWERTSRLVGGIWSRDGYLRWYSVNVAFRIEVVGNYMEKIDDHQFHLVPEEA